MELVDQIDVKNQLGECILWNDKSQKVWWTDIEGRMLYSRGIDDTDIQTYVVPERLCSFGFIENSGSLICGFESGIGLFSPDSGIVSWLVKTRQNDSLVRLNDGRIDRWGRFWVGEMSENFANDPIPQTHLYCLEKGGKLSIHERQMQISNGLCWSPDGQNMYFADSPKNELYVYDYDQKTRFFSNKRVFATTPKGIHPDGSCVDVDGFVWNAQWGSGKIIRYARNGKIDLELDIPCMQPTCVAFGGPNLDHLFVTTAALDLENEAAGATDGNVFIYQTSYKGLVESRFLS